MGRLFSFWLFVVLGVSWDSIPVLLIWISVSHETVSRSFDYFEFEIVIFEDRLSNIVNFIIDSFDFVMETKRVTIN